MPAGNHTVGNHVKPRNAVYSFSEFSSIQDAEFRWDSHPHKKHVFIWDHVNKPHSAAVAYNDLFSFQTNCRCPSSQLFRRR